MKYQGIIYRPPSEAKSLLLQVTIGCAHNKCSFCNMYRDKKFQIRNQKEILEEIKEAGEKYGSYVTRVFLCDGDALVLPAERLLEILEHLQVAFPLLERVTSYGTPQDICRKSQKDLLELKQAGLSMIYMGAESGSDRILEKIHKGADRTTLIQAAKKMKEADMKLSVTLISGLLGKAMSQEHALDSASLISQMKPSYVSFLTLMPEPGTQLEKEISEGKVKLLTPEETAEELDCFLSHTDSEGSVFRSNHASNYLTLAGDLNKDIPRMRKQLEELMESNSYRKEEWRLL